MARAPKSSSASAVPFNASSSKLTFAGTSALFSDTASVAVAKVTALKERGEKDDHPSPPHPCLNAGPEMCIFSSIASRPRGLIVLLWRFASSISATRPLARWWRRRPSRPGPLLRGDVVCCDVPVALDLLNQWRLNNAPLGSTDP